MKQKINACKKTSFTVTNGTTKIFTVTNGTNKIFAVINGTNKYLV